MGRAIDWLADRGVVTIALLLAGLVTLGLYLWLFTVVTLAVFSSAPPNVPGSTATAYGLLLGGPALALTIIGALNSKWLDRLNARRPEK